MRFRLNFWNRYLFALATLCVILIFIVRRDKKENQKPWFLKNGTLYPTPGHRNIWPNQLSDDRIVEQLMFIPEKIKNNTKKILLYGRANWYLNEPVFFYCPVSKCELMSNNIQKADAIVFKGNFGFPKIKNRSKQIWIYYMLESPLHTDNYILLNNTYNWTATYRSDSDIVAPYGKWVYYDSEKKQKTQNKNYAEGKTHQVAMFVSNCRSRNGRLKYATELGKYINVDIYGACGTYNCIRNDEACFKLLNEKYKFYLAFENSNCKEYITEKFYLNALENNILPIVMGARREDYKKNAPENSYIHVDDFESPEKLADYLLMLDINDELYNEYFKWKGTGELINTYFFCRLCALLHANPEPKIYPNMEEWWSEKSICT